jgi:hypothetical protein
MTFIACAGAPSAGGEVSTLSAPGPSEEVDVSVQLVYGIRTAGVANTTWSPAR